MLKPDLAQTEKKPMEIQLKSEITWPNCWHKKLEAMPTLIAIHIAKSLKQPT